jgi:dihydrofolate reductase
MDSTSVEITLIAALSRDFGIGGQGKLPWHIPEDLKRFRARTRGHPVVMGRKTFESIGRALPERPNWIITRTPAAVRTDLPGDIRVTDSLESALEEARAWAGERGLGEVFVIGGGEIYSQALPWADRLDLTEVEVELGARADAFFPRWEASQFRETFSERHEPAAGRDFGFCFRVLERVRPA